MNREDLNHDNLQSFLQRHKTHINSRASDITKIIKKAESDHTFRKIISVECSSSLSQNTSQTPRSSVVETSNKKSTIFKNDSNVSTTLSPASYLIDSLGDVDTDKNGRILRRDSTNHQNSELTTIKEGHQSFRSSYFKINARVSSPSNKTDPGFLNDASFFSDNDSFNLSRLDKRLDKRVVSRTVLRLGSIVRSKSPYKRRPHEQSSKMLMRSRCESKELKMKFSQESPNKFYMIQPLYMKEEEGVSSPLWRNRNLLNLDGDIFTKDIISCAKRLDSTSFSNYIKELISYVSRSRNQLTLFFARRAKTEAHYSILFKEKERAVFEKLLMDLCARLKEESVSFKQKYNREINYFSERLSKIINRTNKTSFKLEEKEFQTMSEKLAPLLNEPLLLASQSTLKFTSNYIQHIIKKFDSPLKIQPLDSSAIPVIEHITLPRLLEKVIAKYNKTTFFRDVLIYTYDLYITPINLMLYFIFKFFIPQPLNMSRSELQAFQDSQMGKTKIFILYILTFWLEERSLDFLRTPSLLTILSTFLEIIQASERNSPFVEAIQYLWELHKKITQKLISDEPGMNDSTELSNFLVPTKVLSSPTRELVKKRARKAMTNQNKALGFTSFSLERDINVNYDINIFFTESPQEIAKQLTLIDWKHFSRIEPGEVLNKKWTKGDRKECPNYWRHVCHFNAFSSWAQYMLLSQETQEKRVELMEKFLQIAIICVEHYRNYSSSNSIFSALLALCNFGVISLEAEQKKEFDKLASLFAPYGSYLKVYNHICKDTLPLVPNLNIFLKIFLKLQEGVNFTTTLPDNKLKNLKFQSLVQIHDYCKQMKKFQKEKYHNIDKKHCLYQFLKTGFKETVSIDLENAEQVNTKISEMVQPLRKNQTKLMRFFGLKT